MCRVGVHYRVNINACVSHLGEAVLVCRGDDDDDAAGGGGGGCEGGGGM